MDKDSIYWCIFVARHFYSCGSRYARLTTKRGRNVKDGRGNYRYVVEDCPLRVASEHDGDMRPCFESSALKFATSEQAVAKARELQECGLLPKDAEIRVNGRTDYGSYKSVILILERPLSDVVGHHRAFQLTFAKENPSFRYTNDRRFQLQATSAISSERNFLIYDTEKKQVQGWTTDRTKATLFTRDEQYRVQEVVNKEISYGHPLYKGYVIPSNLPAVETSEPIFKRGDKVVYSHNGADVEGEVEDVVSFGNGWEYEVTGIYYGYSTGGDDFETSPFTHLEKEVALRSVG